ncbi:MAG: hypothetical protein IPK60_04565 [Sandaracinaceae bacterium]|nr:hypothetical protein [Sandaracinaceae bacterium]
MRLGRIAILPLAVLLLASAPGSFDGCSCTAEVPTPLPRVDAGFCSADDECPHEICADVRCIAGSCIQISSAIDRDRDGHSPAPCGDDCNDGDAFIYTGATELCDGVDNDCDGERDENADYATDVVELSDGSANTVVVPWTPEFMITTGSNPILGRRMDRFGNLSAPMSLFRGPASMLRAVANSSGAVLLVTVGELADEIYFVTLTPDASGLAMISAEHSISVAGAVTNIELTHNGEVWGLVYDVTNGEAYSRSLVRIADGEDASTQTSIPLESEALSPNGIGITSHADGFAVTDNGNHVHLVDALGVIASSIDAPDASLRFAEGPLASLTGHLVIAYEEGPSPSADYPVFARFADVGTALTWETVTAVGSEASLGALSIAGAGQTLVAWRGSASHTDVSVFDDTGTFVFRQSVRHAGNVVGPRTLAERGNTLVVVEQHAVQPATAIFVRSCVSH